MKEKLHLYAAAICLILAAITGFVTNTNAQTIPATLTIHIWPGAPIPDGYLITSDINNNLEGNFSWTIQYDSLAGNEFSLTNNTGSTWGNAWNWSKTEGLNLDSCVQMFVFPYGSFTNADGTAKANSLYGSGADSGKTVIVIQDPSFASNGLNGVACHELTHTIGRSGHYYTGDCGNAPPWAENCLMGSLGCGSQMDSISILLMAAHHNIMLHTTGNSFWVSCDSFGVTLTKQIANTGLELQKSLDNGVTWTFIQVLPGDGESFTNTAKSSVLLAGTTVEPSSLWRLWQSNGQYQVADIAIPPVDCLPPLPLGIITGGANCNETWLWTENEEQIDTVYIEIIGAGYVTGLEPMNEPGPNHYTANISEWTTSDSTVYVRWVFMAGDSIDNISDIMAVTGCTSGTHEEFPPKFNLFPNPTTNWISANWGNTARIEIYNTLGQAVLNTSIDQSSISVESLNSGLYLLYGYKESGEMSGIGKFLKK